MVDRINQSNTADLVKELLDAEKRAEEETARRAQIEAQAVAQAEAQDIEIQEESVAGTEDISAQASAQQDRGAQWAAFSANESSATESSSSDAESDAEKVNVQDLLNQMKIESGKISS